MRKILLGLLAAFTSFASPASAADNYAATAGSGLTFGAKDASGVLYSRFIGCDNTTVAQCWSIDSSGRQLMTITSGSVASGAFASGSIASGAMVDLGAIADAAATAGGTGSLSAKLRLMTTQLDAINTNVQGAIPAGTALIGDVNVRQGGTALSITNPSFSRPVATATGGASTTGNIAANNTTAVVIKASAGTLYGAQLAGLGSAPAYLKIYNATSATCGSGTPVKRLMIPAASTAANGAGSNVTFGSAGVDFSTGITYCITTGIADSDTTAPAASTFLVNLDWK